MSKFFIGFLIVFAVVGIAYRLNVNMHKVVPVEMVTYTDDELGITLTYPEGEKFEIGPAVLIPTGATALETMAKAVVMDGSGMNPETSRFVREVSPYTTIYYVQSGRFEGMISYDGFVVKNNFVFPIRYRWDGVTNWNDPSYEPTKDPHFKIFLDTLKSVQFINIDPGQYEGTQG